MRLRILLAASMVLACAVLCTAQTPKGHLVVSASGGAGNYKTVQDAVDHANGPTIILIRPGVYHEKVTIDRNDIWLIGTGLRPDDVVLTNGDSARNTGSTFKSGTVIVNANGFAAENLNIANTWWDEHPKPEDASQAVALQLSSDRAVLDRVKLLSGQDTLYAASLTCHNTDDSQSCIASREYFQDCFIQGNVDYIFGDALAVFQSCELHSRPHHTVMITAQSRHSPTEKSGYYFIDCKITGANNGDQVVLGRPWRDYATVFFLHTQVSQRLAQNGWSDWGGRLKTATYREYDSYGPGVNAGQHIVSYPPLSEEEKNKLTPVSLLGGSDLWNPRSEVVELRKLSDLNR